MDKVVILKEKIKEAHLGGGAKRIESQHKKGKLTARERLLLLLRILDEIATSHDMEMISNSDYMHNIKENEIDRMNSVYEYIIKNYLGDISLPQAALIANMHESAFCKYFKKRM